MAPHQQLFILWAKEIAIAMEDWQKRLIDEEEELAVRIRNLTVFIENPTLFRSLDPSDQALLFAQRAHMKDYQSILVQRIARLPARRSAGRGPCPRLFRYRGRHGMKGP